MITGNIFTPDLADSIPRRAGPRAHPSPKPRAYARPKQPGKSAAVPLSACPKRRDERLRIASIQRQRGDSVARWSFRASGAGTDRRRLACTFVSPLLLGAHGIDYETAGGSALAKIHPGTYLAVAALMARLGAAPHPWRSLQRLLLAEPGLAIYLAALALMAVYVVAIARTPVTPLIDTFLPALVLTLMALRSVSPARLPSCWWRFSPPMRC
jgi:hypothetical protein